MRILKIILIIQIVFTSFIIQGCAESGVMDRRDRRRALFAKRQAMKEREGYPEQMVIKRDIPYSKDLSPLKMLDVYTPKGGNGKFPVLIHIHGGGWKIGDKSYTKEHGLFYASRGILFISVNYRLSPEVKHPVHIEDCAEAISWVFAHLKDLGGDIDRVFVSGHSAGAHLAALLGTDPKYLQEYSLNPGMLAGVFTVDTASFDLTSGINEKMVKSFIKEAFGSDPEVLKEASPIYNVTDNGTYPAFLILASGKRDSSITQGKNLADRLKNSGNEARFIVVADHSHREMNQGMYNASDPVGAEILSTILTPKN